MNSVFKRCLMSCGFVASLAMSQSQAGEHGPSLTVLWPEDAKVQSAYQEIKKSGVAEEVIKMAEERMALKGQLTIILGGGGEPRLTPDSGAVVMPYEHLLSIKNDVDFSISANEAQQQQVALDAFSYSLVHRLAHATIKQQQESGQWLGDDAVADLAMLTVLDHMPNGGRIARNALRLFDKGAVGMQRNSTSFWVKNSLNSKRYDTGVCQLVGSGYSMDSLFGEAPVNEAVCAEQFALLRNSWSEMFVPGLTPVQPAASVASR